MTMMSITMSRPVCERRAFVAPCRSMAAAVFTIVAMSMTSRAGIAAEPAIALVGGRVYPVSGPMIENATVVMAGGKITAVGPGLAPPAGAQVVDTRGLWVTPGLINASTALGLVEVMIERSSADNQAAAERGVAAAFRSWDGLNPASVLWAAARNDGVTAVVSQPSGGLVAGQGALVRTVGATRGEMLRKAPVAMFIDLTSPTASGWKSRGEAMMTLRQLLDDARDYAGHKAQYELGMTRSYGWNRSQLEALEPMLAGKLRAVIAVDRADDIVMVLELCQEYKLQAAILSGAEAWKVADRLAAAKVPVVTTALDNLPASFAALGFRQENAAILRKAGVPVILSAAGGPGRLGAETFNVRNVRQQAGNAVAYGMSWDDALRAVTLTPAELCGVDAVVGSITVGKEADLVVWTGDPFELKTRTEHVYIGGRDVKAPSRQDMLTERYRNRGNP
jgi:imidazolonepropionase-like amidohydrolase